MKKTLITLAIVLLAVVAQAQIKMHGDSHVSIGTLSSSWDTGTQIYPSGRVFFNTSDTTHWHWVTMATPGCPTGKCWIVTYPGNKYKHLFFVSGYGYVYQRGRYTASDAATQMDPSEISNPGAVLDSITGVWYTPIDEEDGGAKGGENRRVGISAQELKRVLPEAVTDDENGMLYVDYDALTVFLIETVKEQREQIKAMRKNLEEHGMMEPEKP